MNSIHGKEKHRIYKQLVVTGPQMMTTTLKFCQTLCSDQLPDSLATLVFHKNLPHRVSEAGGIIIPRTLRNETGLRHHNAHIGFVSVFHFGMVHTHLFPRRHRQSLQPRQLWTNRGQVAELARLGFCRCQSK